MESRWKKIISPSPKKNITGGFTGRDQRRGSKVEAPAPKKGTGEMVQILPMSLQEETMEDRPIDTNLIVGPFYDNSNRQKTAIKEQLSDITKRLHQTLNTFDTLESFEETSKADILDKVRRKIKNMEASETKDQFSSFLIEYEDMSSNVAEANQERDELLLQLADWFTTDHVDLDDVKMGLDSSEESELNESYKSTLVDFEKLKSLQSRIESGALRAQELRILEEEKKKVEKQVVTNMKLMKTKSIQNVRKKSTDDSAWKHAADEIVGMLKKVRMEGSEEIEMLTKRVRKLLDELETQQWKIKSLNSEIRREKSIKTQLTDETTDLKVQIGQLNETIKKYEKDLEMSRKMIEKQFEELSKRRKSYEEEDDDEEDDDEDENDEEGPKKTVSELMDQVMGDDRSLREMPSEPYILRSRIRQQSDNISELTKQLQEMEGRLIDFERVIEAKDAVIDDMQSENDTLTEKIFALETEIKEKDAEQLAHKLSRLTVKSTESCQKCKDLLLHGTGDSSLELKNKELLQSKDEEIERLNKSVQYFKKLLSETEMKLSEAYRDISDLRMNAEHMVVPVIEKKESTVIPVIESPVEEIVIKRSPTPESVEPPEPEVPQEGEVKVATLKEAPNVKMRVKSPLPQQKPQMRPKREQKEKVSLPPLVRQPTKFSREIKPPETQDPEAKTKREQVLYQVGDLQSKLNVVSQMIMDFVSRVGNLIYSDKNEDEVKLQSMRTFEFGQEQKQKKEAESKDNEGKQKKSQAFINGQQACALLREVYELLSAALKLKHSEYETIYRSFKNTQRRLAMQRAAFIGQNPFEDLYSAQGVYGANGMANRGFSLNGGRETQDTTGQTNLSQRHDISPWGKAEYDGKDFIGISGEDMFGQREFNGTVLVHGIHRSKSELDIHSTLSNDSLTTQLLRERSQVFLTHVPDHVRDRKVISSANREEASIAKTTVPKKGLIKLTSLHQELKNPALFEKREKEVLPMDEVREKQRKQQVTMAQQKMLIKRKDILNQVMLGNQQLMEEEEKHNIQENIGLQLQNYTFGDLHNNMNMYTTTSGRRSSELSVKESEILQQQPSESPPNVKATEIQTSKKGAKSPVPHVQQQTKSTTSSRDSKKIRGVALPAINMLNPFGS